MKYAVHLLCMLCALTLHAQDTMISWQNTITAHEFDLLTDVRQTMDGGCIVAGSSRSTISGDKTEPSMNPINPSRDDYWVLKLDASGNIVWQNTLGGGDTDVCLSICQTTDGGYLAGGYSSSYISPDKTENPRGFNSLVDYWIVKLDAGGTIVWDKTIGGNSPELLRSVQQTSDGGYILAGGSHSDISGEKTENARGDMDYWVVKLDSARNIVWQKTIGGSAKDQIYQIQQTADGGYILGGESESGISADKTEASYGNLDYWVIKLDAVGNITWQKTFGGSERELFTSLQQTADGGYIVAGESESGISGNKTEASQGSIDYWVLKLDAAGNILWQNTIGGSNEEKLPSIHQTVNGGYMLAGESRSGISGDKTEAPLGLGDYWLVQLDAGGDIIWQNVIGGTSSDFFGVIRQTTDEGFIMGGSSISGAGADKTEYSMNSYDYWVLKLKPVPIPLYTLNTPYITVKGNVFKDVNSNCANDTADLPHQGILVKAEPGPYYAMTDVAGNYSLRIFNTGSFTISVVPYDTLFHPSCTTTRNVQANTFYTAISNINFATTTDYFCPRLTVYLGTDILRRCFNSTYTFTYRNTGTLPAVNTFVEVDFGDSLQPQSSTLPWSTVSGNVYTFQTGNLGINQQGVFKVTALVNCSAPLGSTQCVTAHIYPDSLCYAAPAGWDKSEVTVKGTCVHDSLVCFTIKNQSTAGPGNMNSPAQWRLYANDTLIAQGAYQLAGQDSLVKCLPANGKTYRLEADQTHPHPRRSTPRAIIEGCGMPSNIGFVNTVAADDAELFIETFCMEVTGSFDPNDKQVVPGGITSNRYITAEDELEYLIRFQNTGNDTAFKVVIRDTIATHVLNLATLTMGTSSHPYTFNIYGHGIAEWTFSNIMLPDSNTNEAASHGYIQFKIQQLPGNPVGTLIENRAAIYFDFNAPVLTNTAWNEVNQGAMPQSLVSGNVSLVTNATCKGKADGMVEVMAAHGLPPYQYAWSNGNTTAHATALAAGTYTVTITDAAEGIFIGWHTITEPPLLAVSINIESPVSCFGDADAILNLGVTGGVAPYQYHWSHGAVNPTSFAAGAFTLTVIDDNNCEGIDTVTVAQGHLVNAGTMAGPDTISISQNAAYSVNPGLGYTWRVANGTILSGQGTNNIEVDWNTIGQGSVLAIVTDMGCIDTVAKTITLTGPTGIETTSLDEITLYPNPTNSTFTMKIGNAQTTALVSLYDAIGKKLLQQTATSAELQQGITIETSAWSKGIFFFQIETQNGSRIMKVVRE